MDNPSHEFLEMYHFTAELRCLIVDIDFVSEGLGVKKGNSKKKKINRTKSKFFDGCAAMMRTGSR